MFSDNPNVSVGFSDRSLYSQRIVLKNYYHLKMGMLLCTPMKLIYLETPAKTFVIPARQKKFIQENYFNNAPIRRTAFAMNTNSAFKGPYTENPF